MKTLVITLTLLIAIAFFSTPVNAADVTLRWDPATGAAGYKIYSSIDNGVTWSTPVDVANVTQKTLTSQPDNTLVLYKVSAYNTTGEAVAHWRGSWYDGRKKPPDTPAGNGIQ